MKNMFSNVVTLALLTVLYGEVVASECTSNYQQALKEQREAAKKKEEADDKLDRAIIEKACERTRNKTEDERKQDSNLFSLLGFPQEEDLARARIQKRENLRRAEELAERKRELAKVHFLTLTPEEQQKEIERNNYMW